MKDILRYFGLSKRARGAKAPEEGLHRFGQRLREARIEKRLTGKKLGRLVGVGPSTISQWETGERVPALRHLHAVGKVLEKPVCYFLGYNHSDREHLIQH